MNDGSVAFGEQRSGSSFGPYPESVLPLDDGTKALYGDITGRYMQDVTLTPRFDVSGELAQAMWQRENRAAGERRHRHRSGDARVPPQGHRPGAARDRRHAHVRQRRQAAAQRGYAKYADPNLQDAFFASAASAVFEKVSSGGFDAKQFVAALTQSAGEGRLRLWSADTSEEQLIDGTVVAGALPTADQETRQFGVYLNDGTGSKMDYYLQKTISVGSSVCGRTACRPPRSR